MPGPTTGRCLSSIDAAFIYLERREIPLNIGGVAVFDGPIPLERFVAVIDSRLHLIPRYRQVVVQPPFTAGCPTWEDYPRFDIRDHIIHVELPAPGGECELEALAGRLLGQVMDRNKPLWSIHVVDGLQDGRGALVVRAHHALADGIAAEALLKVIFDATPEGTPVVPPAPVSTLEQKPQNRSLFESIAGAVHSSLRNMVAAEAALLDFAQALFTERMQTGLQGLLTLLPEWAKPVERLPFNRPCGGERKFCWTEIDFNSVKAIRASLGGTVNDVILAIVTRAVARYTRFHRRPVEDRFVRIVCPVNVRHEDRDGLFGNQITFLPVVLPLGVDEPAELLRAVTTRMEIMKSVRVAELLAIAGNWIGAAPPPLQAFFWEGIPMLPLPAPLFNLICTNVPGSPTPLYSVGRRMVASYPQVPTGYELGIGIAVQSYDGKMFFGVTADAGAAPDAGRFRDFLQAAYRDLCRAAGIRQPHRRKPRTRLAAATKTAPSISAAATGTPIPNIRVLRRAREGSGNGTGAAQVPPARPASSVAPPAE